MGLNIYFIDKDELVISNKYGFKLISNDFETLIDWYYWTSVIVDRYLTNTKHSPCNKSGFDH